MAVKQVAGSSSTGKGKPGSKGSAGGNKRSTASSKARGRQKAGTGAAAGLEGQAGHAEGKQQGVWQMADVGEAGAQRPQDAAIEASGRATELLAR